MKSNLAKVLLVFATLTAGCASTYTSISRNEDGSYTPDEGYERVLPHQRDRLSLRWAGTDPELLGDRQPLTTAIARRRSARRRAISLTPGYRIPG